MSKIFPISESNMVQVKFTFSSLDLIPLSVKKVARDSDQRKDVAHQREALRNGLDPSLTVTSRHREGRVDTGEQVVVLRNQLVGVGDLLDQLLSLNRLKLVDVYYYKRGGIDKDPTYTLVFTFSTDEDREPKYEAIEADTQEALNAARKLTAAGAYVWANPNATWTVNMTGWSRKPPKRRLVLKDDRIDSEVIGEANKNQAA